MSETQGSFLTDETDETGLDGLLADYFARLDAGEATDRAAWIAQHPEFADALTDYFETADEIDRMAGPVMFRAVPAIEDLYRRPVQEATAIADTHLAADEGDSVRIPDHRSEAEDSAEDATQAALPRPQADTGALQNGQSLPRRFGRYVIERCLGQGAMGTVYLAEDGGLGRKVALKVPKLSPGAGAELMERFYREARSAARLSHRNICPVYDVGELGGVYYLTMGFIAGRPLKDFVHPEHLQPQRQAAAIVRKLALALEHAHHCGIVHRDLKPANIMIDTEREPVIMDFGLARPFDQPVDLRMTQSGVIVGTPGYMPPEQVEGDHARIGPASDIYSLGVILYELLTGDLPFKGSLASVMSQILSSEPPPPSLLRPDLDPALESICLKMMAKDVAGRYGSMRDVAEALGEFLRTGREDGSAPGDSSRLPAFERPEPDRPVGIAGLRSRLHEQQRRAEALIRLGRYDVALRILASMASVSEPTLSTYTRWAERELPRIREACDAAAAREEAFRPTEALHQDVLGRRPAARRLAIAAVLIGVGVLAWAGAAFWGRPSRDRGEAATQQPQSGEIRAGAPKTGTGIDARQSVRRADEDAARAPRERANDPRELLRIDTPGPPRSMVVLPDGRAAVATFADGQVGVWDLDNGRQIRRLALDDVDQAQAAERAGQSGLLAVSADGSRFALAAGMTIRVWNADGSHALDISTEQPVLAIGLASDGRQVFAAFDAFGPRRVRTRPPSAGFGPPELPFNGRRVIQGFDVQTGQRVRGMSSFVMPSVTAAAFAANGSRAVVAGLGGRLTVFDLVSASSHDPWPFGPHVGPVNGIVFSRDGRRLATFGGATLTVRDAVGARAIDSFGIAGDVAALSHDGTYALSAGDDSTIVLRQIGRASPLAQFAGHTDRVTALAFVPGRRLAVSAGADKTLRIWRLPEEFQPSPVADDEAAGNLRVPVYRRP